MISFQDTGEFYTGPSAWDEIGNYNSDNKDKQKEFKAFVLCDVDDKVLLLKNASVLYHVRKLSNYVEVTHQGEGLYVIYITEGRRPKVV